ncbi:EthD domain-containing protein [Talaromyces proteolyticus]|uniref:EthD domain-containing protein n=1 Tax=Talaromyces proteolyticus TaxID=1131652 RepID=A0AAD4PZJ7_9EURO|nr:EthD domain-containing protein [Talaromyces proteolyticus]KAH8703068.1 EthD domain-containing protein [Talaromyces proteolyticus]
MPIHGLVIAYRKPDTTPTEFQNHYENNHVPILQRLAGEDFFLSHQRFYLARGEAIPAPATVVLGDDQDFEYDALTIVTFKDQEHMNRFYAKIGTPEAKKEIEEDEARFLDRTRLKVILIGDVRKTVNESA